MTVATLKEYLKALKFGGMAVDNTLNAIVDAAAEAGFGKVWGAHVWKVSRGYDTSLATVSGQAYTTLPKDFDGIKTAVLLNGMQSRKINIVGEDNFDYDYPNPAAWSNTMPLRAKLVYNAPQSNDRWRLYWERVPDGAYSMNLVYRRMADVSFLPNCPGYMTEPIMICASALILPPGPTQNNVMAAAQAALNQAIDSDNEFVGSPEMLGTEAGFNDCFTADVVRGGRLDWPFG